jgi:hypothetical protein
MVAAADPLATALGISLTAAADAGSGSGGSGGSGGASGAGGSGGSPSRGGSSS